ncbi:MAG: hypothetical protein EB101_08375 [Chitinophagia bacterium]|nr:hypothetical protein [Chitinophagia bacterium]
MNLDPVSHYDLQGFYAIFRNKGVYTQIPNELFDYLPSLSGAAIKVLMIVARRTYGWHKSTAQISMNTFEDLTGLSRSSVARAITELGNAGLLHVQKLKIDNVNEINCYEILLPVENSDKPVENSNEGSSKMKLPHTQSSQAENKTAHTVQELSTGEGGSSKMKLGVVLKSNLYKEKYKDQTRLVQRVEYHQLNLNCNDTAPVSSVLLNQRDCRTTLLRQIFIR